MRQSSGQAWLELGTNTSCWQTVYSKLDGIVAMKLVIDLTSDWEHIATFQNTITTTSTVSWIFAIRLASRDEELFRTMSLACFCKVFRSEKSRR